MSTHVVLAKAVNVPELAITDDEGKQFLQACENVARHYSVTTTQKTLDWFALAGATVQIYGTRLMVILADRKKAPAVPKAPNSVAPLRSTSEPGPQLAIVPNPED